jgi:hypothetical protein
MKKNIHFLVNAIKVKPLRLLPGAAAAFSAALAVAGLWSDFWGHSLRYQIGILGLMSIFLLPIGYAAAQLTWKQFQNRSFPFIYLLLSMGVTLTLLPLVAAYVNSIRYQYTVEMVFSPKAEASVAASEFTLAEIKLGAEKIDFGRLTQRGHWEETEKLGLQVFSLIDPPEDGPPGLLLHFRDLPDDGVMSLIFLSEPNGGQVRLRHNSKSIIVDLHSEDFDERWLLLDIDSPWASILMLAYAILILFIIFTGLVWLVPQRLLERLQNDWLPEWLSAARTLLENPATHYVILALLAGAYTMFIIGDIGVHIAHWNDDIGTISVPHYLKNPERFSQDMFMVTMWRFELVSLPAMITTLLYLTAEIPPAMSAIVIVYLQNILSILAVYRLARVLLRNKQAAWLTAVFCFAFLPWEWNIAALAGLHNVVYSQNLSLPIILFAAAYLLERKRLAAMILMGLSGLIHPTLTLIMIAILGMYYILQALEDKNLVRFLGQLAVLGGVALITAAPTLILTSGIEPGPVELQWKSIEGASHLFPWRPYCGYCYKSFWRFLVLLPPWALLTYMGLRRLSPGKRISQFLLAATLATVVLSAAHLIALEMEIVLLARMVLIRSTLLWLAFSSPFVISALWSRFSALSLVGKAVVVCTLLSPANTWLWAAAIFILADEPLVFFEQPGGRQFQKLLRLCGAAIFSLTLLGGLSLISNVLALPRLEQIIISDFNLLDRTFIIKDMGFTILLVCIGIVVGILFNRPQVWTSIWSSMAINREELKAISGLLLPAGLLACGILAAVPLQNPDAFRSSPILLWLAIIFLILTSLAASIQMNFEKAVSKGQLSGTGLSKQLLLAFISIYLLSNTLSFYQWQGINSGTGERLCSYEAQIWAKNNTPEDASFLMRIVDGHPDLTHWRNLTGRPTIIPFGGLGLYLNSMDYLAYGNEIMAFYEEYKGESVEVTNTNLYGLFYQLNEEDLREFSLRFGGDYIVSNQALNLPEVFSNECLNIYQLDP